MKPLDRRGFLLATLGTLVAAGLVVLHARRGSVWTEWLVGTFGPADAPTVFLAAVLMAGVLVAGLWCWFVARRFLALLMPRWPAALPFLLWSVACVLILVALQRHDPTPDIAGARPVLGDRPGPSAPVGEDFEHVAREHSIVQNLAFSSLGFAALSILTAAWCAARGLRRDPTPVEDHFT